MIAVCDAHVNLMAGTLNKKSSFFFVTLYPCSIGQWAWISMVGFDKDALPFQCICTLQTRIFNSVGRALHCVYHGRWHARLRAYNGGRLFVSTCPTVLARLQHSLSFYFLCVLPRKQLQLTTVLYQVHFSLKVYVKLWFSIRIKEQNCETEIVFVSKFYH